MTGELGRLKPVLAAALVLLFAAEWLWPGAGVPAGHEALVISGAAADEGTDAASTQWADTILARPLFEANRRPAAAPAAVTEDVPPHLTAIIINGAEGYAVFSVNGEKPQDVGKGGNIGGYMVKTIAADRVQLLGASGLLTLRPQFAAAAASAD